MSKDVHKVVREAYGKVAGSGSSCCGDSEASSRSSCCEPAEQIFCGPAESPCCGKAVADVAAQADMGLSCGNPIMLAEVAPGETVLDLGSGAGRDVFPAAEKVGPEGRAIGVDMTPEMLVRARE
ncbi:MAG: methyltransferase domain-containing protein, partial [Anaerolineaceae bacterium]|nr:methyltransferase domain-containing protein [Anaerolineaceae bacterium]